MIYPGVKDPRIKEPVHRLKFCQLPLLILVIQHCAICVLFIQFVYYWPYLIFLLGDGQKKTLFLQELFPEGAYDLFSQWRHLRVKMVLLELLLVPKTSKNGPCWCISPLWMFLGSIGAFQCLSWGAAQFHPEEPYILEILRCQLWPPERIIFLGSPEFRRIFFKAK